VEFLDCTVFLASFIKKQLQLQLSDIKTDPPSAKTHGYISSPSAPPAADLESALYGVKHPKTKHELVEYASQKRSTIGKEVSILIKSLPSRTYRVSAEVAIALGEFKSGKGFRSAKQAEATEQPSKKGGKAAVPSSISSASIAKALSGIDFPKTKVSLMQYVQKHISKLDIQHSRSILNILDQIADREYSDMAEIEQEIGKIK
jgi:hypothetical protein